MTTAQKVIKYFALALGIFLIVTIVTAIINFGCAMVSGFSFVNKTPNSKLNFNNYDSYIDASIRYAKLDIKVGDELNAEATSDKIIINRDGNKLTIKDTDKSRHRMKDEKVTIYIPREMKFDAVSIRSGAGTINIDALSTKELELLLGAGETIINDINSDKTKIDTGVGSLGLNNAILNDLDLDIGIGSINIRGNILGNSKIEAGIGELNLYLNGNTEDYTFDIEKGIGSISLNHKKLSEGKVGNGINKINIDGGIGSIDIYTK